MSNKNLNWNAYWRIVHQYRWSPLSNGYPPMKTEEMTNWFNCNEEMGRRFTNNKEDYLLS